MKSEKVDIVDYADGERKVVGYAYVDLDGPNIDITGTITDAEYAAKKLSPVKLEHLSIAYKGDKRGSRLQ